MKICISLILLCLIGCAGKEVSDFKPEVYTIATRQLPPEPVYNPVTWVRPPQMLPERDIPLKNAPLLLPVIHYQIKDATLYEAAIVLAGSVRYKAYCASALANRKVSYEVLGNIEEIANQIAVKENIKVLVDHYTKSIRFFPLN